MPFKSGTETRVVALQPITLFVAQTPTAPLEGLEENDLWTSGKTFTTLTSSTGPEKKNFARLIES